MANEAVVKTHPVRVRIREVPYSVISRDLLGNAQVEQRSGYGPGRQEILPSTRNDVDEETAKLDYELGQLIEVNDADYVRLKNAGCIVDEDEVIAVGDGEDVQVLDVRTASVEELADWIREEKPTAHDVVQASGGEPDLAQSLLEAENAATDGEPRKSVLDGLSKVISRG